MIPENSAAGPGQNEHIAVPAKPGPRVLPAQAGPAPCPTCGGAAPAAMMSAPYIYPLGQIEARFPRISVEKEFAQAAGRVETAGRTDQQVLYEVLHRRENHYLARQMCWVLMIQGLETYILGPRDPADITLLIGAIEPHENPWMSLVIGTRGPISPCAAMARSRQAHRSPRSSRSGLRLVHRRLRHARLETGQGLARRAGVLRKRGRPPKIFFRPLARWSLSPKFHARLAATLDPNATFSSLIKPRPRLSLQRFAGRFGRCNRGDESDDGKHDQVD
jgi:PatG Domain